MAANGCSACGPGTYQPEDDYRGMLCTNCPTGTYMPNETATACFTCDKPFCAKTLETCNPISGLEATYTYYNIFEVLSKVCSPAPADDPCASPFLCVPGAAQCSSVALRHPMRFGQTQTIDIMGSNPCPHLADPNSMAHPACWDQRAEIRGDGIVRTELLYSALSSEHTVMLPTALQPATCNSLPVVPRFQYFFIACRPGAAECSDELIDCPSSAGVPPPPTHTDATTTRAHTSPRKLPPARPPPPHTTTTTHKHTRTRTRTRKHMRTDTFTTHTGRVHAPRPRIEHPYYRRTNRKPHP